MLFALRHEGGEIAPFLMIAMEAIAAVVLGRVVTTQLLLTARRRRVVAHRTILIGGGVRSAEMATSVRRSFRAR